MSTRSLRSSSLYETPSTRVTKAYILCPLTYSSNGSWFRFQTDRNNVLIDAIQKLLNFFDAQKSHLKLNIRVRDCYLSYTSCSTPTTAASAHFGCETRADSTSAVPIRWPLHISRVSDLNIINELYVYSYVHACTYEERNSRIDKSLERDYGIQRIPDINDIVNSPSKPIVSIFIPETKSSA